MTAANKAPAYQWYPRDFAGDEPVQLMTLEEEGAYRRLLDFQWLNGSIPSDLKQLARICKNVPVPRMRRIWGALQPCFVAVENDPSRLLNRRLERVRAESQEYRERQSRAGKRGAEATWGEGEAGDGKRYVYAMVRESDGAIKIGVSRSPARRAAHLALNLIAQGPGGFTAEREAQVKLAGDRIGTEWFADTPAVRAWIAKNMPWSDQGGHQGEAMASPWRDQGSASASASASASTVGRSDPAAPAGDQALLDRFASPAERSAIWEFLERAPQRDRHAWISRLGAYLDGQDFPPGSHPTPAHLATACRDYSGNFAPVHFRGFVLRAIEGPRPRTAGDRRTSGQDRTERTLAAADRFVKGGADAGS